MENNATWSTTYTKEQFAQLLNGRPYRDEIENEEAEIAKANNLIVCFGASDDLLEFRGVIEDELGAWDGCTAHLYFQKNKWQAATEESLDELKSELEDRGIEFNLKTHEVKAIWSPDEPECSWLIKTEIPHATFDIFEDGELYCRGIVFSVNDIS